MVVAMIHFPICKVEAIAPVKFNAEFPSNYCSHDASTTPNYWQRAIGRTIPGLGPRDPANQRYCCSAWEVIEML